MKKILIISLAFGALLLSSCSKEYLETAPTQSVDESAAFASLDGANMALQGVHRYTYARIDGNAPSHAYFGQKSVDMNFDTRSDDFFPLSPGYNHGYWEYIWSYPAQPTYPATAFCWKYYYDIINNVNVILANVDDISVTGDAQTAQRDNIKAQALFYRAHSLYYLVQIHADAYVIGGANTALGVPIYTEPTSEGKARNTVAEVYTQINTDLDAAIALFESSPQSRASRMSIDLSVAQAIKARVALQTGDWAKAAAMASAARTGYALEADYSYGWGKVSTEWIWGAVIITEQRTVFASFFSFVDPTFQGYGTLGSIRSISTTVYDAMSATDTRKAVFRNFDNAGVPAKHAGYKFTGFGDQTNDYLYIAAGEMYLIEAEAQAMAGNAGAAQTALFTLVNHRDPGYVQSTSSGEALLAEIAMQRRIDLWGHGLRWFDLKRYGKGMDRKAAGGMDLTIAGGIDVISATDKRWVFVIPQQEMDSNPNMKQNPL